MRFTLSSLLLLSCGHRFSLTVDSTSCGTLIGGQSVSYAIGINDNPNPAGCSGCIDVSPDSAGTSVSDVLRTKDPLCPGIPANATISLAFAIHDTTGCGGQVLFDSKPASVVLGDDGRSDFDATITIDCECKPVNPCTGLCTSNPNCCGMLTQCGMSYDCGDCTNPGPLKTCNQQSHTCVK
jgi:hypothetical protein